MSYNPFQSHELWFPSAYRSDIERYVQKQSGGGANQSPDDSPFERMVDLWFLALCLAARTGKRVKVEDPHKFIQGDILAREPWRIELIELLAIADADSSEALENPARCIDLANEYVAAGLPELLEMLKAGKAKPIWNLTDGVCDLLGSGGAR